MSLRFTKNLKEALGVSIKTDACYITEQEAKSTGVMFYNLVSIKKHGKCVEHKDIWLTDGDSITLGGDILIARDRRQYSVRYGDLW